MLTISTFPCLVVPQMELVYLSLHNTFSFQFFVSVESVLMINLAVLLSSCAHWQWSIVPEVVSWAGFKMWMVLQGFHFSHLHTHHTLRTTCSFICPILTSWHPRQHQAVHTTPCWPPVLGAQVRQTLGSIESQSMWKQQMSNQGKGYTTLMTRTSDW
jgi:hypothetical protein